MRLRVLIVEDDPLQSERLAQMLGSRGYFVDVVSDGRDAAKRLQAGLFDVALIDYRIPQINGLGVALVTRSSGHLARWPRLIALTCAPDDLPPHDSAFDEVLAKPIDPEALLRAIERCRNTDEPPDAGTDLLHTRFSPFYPVAETSEASPPAATRGRILLADDDEHLRDFLRLALEASNLEVDVAQDGLQAVRMVGMKAYDVAVVDFRMPKLDGLAAAKIIYDRLGRRLRPRIVALTSTPESLVAQDGQWHLVLDAIVSKASGVPAIISVVENCLHYNGRRLKQPIEILDLQAVNDLQDTQHRLKAGDYP